MVKGKRGRIVTVCQQRGPGIQGRQDSRQQDYLRREFDRLLGGFSLCLDPNAAEDGDWGSAGQVEWFVEVGREIGCGAQEEWLQATGCPTRTQQRLDARW